MKKYTISIVRIVVGALFVFSGFVKLVDPKGFGYKLEEYFSPDVFNLTFLINYTLELSVLFVVLEVLLGFFLLLGVFKKFTLISLLGLILFFTFLTFYSAYFNAVADCGCFGDAIKLTPWESFYKDLILLVLILTLIFSAQYISPILPKKANYALVGFIFLTCCWIVNQGIQNLPLIDFRPFAVGTNIQKGMEIPPKAPKDSILMVFEYELYGKVLEFTSEELSKIPPEAIFKKRTDKLISEGFKPAIKADFLFDCNGINKTTTFLNQEKLVVVIIPIVDQLNAEGWEKTKQFSDSLKRKDIPVVGAFNDYVDNAEFEQCTMDGTMLKTIIRSNPGIMVLSKGTILAKYHYNHLPKVEKVSKLLVD